MNIGLQAYINNNKELFRYAKTGGYFDLATRIINKKNDRATITPKPFKFEAVVEKCVKYGENTSKYEAQKTKTFSEYDDALFFCLKEIIGLYHADDGRTETEFNNDYCNELNRLLNENGFEERFEQIFNFVENTEKFILKSLHDEDKVIEYYPNEGKLFWMGCYAGIYLTDDFDDNLKKIFNFVSNILQDKVIVSSLGYCTVFADSDSFKYSEKERKYLQPRTRFEVWSDSPVTENMKLFLIGSLYTNHLEIETESRGYYRAKIFGVHENVVWQGKPGKAALNLLPLRFSLYAHLIMAVLFIPVLFTSPRFYLVVGLILPLIVNCIVYPAMRKQIKKWRYTIISTGIIIDYGGMENFYPHKDISSVKIKYASYEKNKKHGTIIIRVPKKRLTSMNNHFYSVPEPEVVYNLLIESIEQQKAKNVSGEK